jgi:hypothetical protein
VRRSGRRKPAPRATKISITVDAAVLRDVKRLIRGTGQSLSAHVTEALQRDLRRRRLHQIIEESETSAGAITNEELERARVAWGG